MTQIQIRPATPDDAEALLEIYSYYVLETAITFEYQVPTMEEFRNRIQKTLERYPYLVAEMDGKICGYTYAGTFKGRAAYDWSVETTIYVDHKLHKSGIGRKLYDALEWELKKMGITNLYACIAYIDIADPYLSPNSAQYHAHMGYKEVGRYHSCANKFDRWYDMVWMEKIIGEHTTPPNKLSRFNTNK